MTFAITVKRKVIGMFVNYKINYLKKNKYN